MLSPIIIGDVYKVDSKRNKILSSVLLIMLIVTMNMLGTKTAGLGLFATFFCIIILFVFFKILKKIEFNLKEFVLKSLLLLSFCVFVFMNSPYYNKNFGKFKLEFEDRPIEEELEEEEDEYVESFADFIEKYSWNYYIEPQLLEIYPVDNDISFWRFVINRDLRLNSNYRIIRTDLYNRILERNDNKGDFLFGIGYNDVLNSEKDYNMQMYYFGIVGILILIGPYIFPLHEAAEGEVHGDDRVVFPDPELDQGPGLRAGRTHHRRVAAAGPLHDPGAADGSGARHDDIQKTQPDRI